MKKLLALLLTLAMVLTFVACGSNGDIRGEQKVNGSTENDTSSAIEEKEFSFGDTKGLNYENKFIGLGCNLDSNWTFYSDEQIKELNNVAADMAGEEYAEAMKNATVIYDMFAVNNNQLDNINVNLEKVNAIQLATLDIAENYEKIYDTVKKTYENMGYSNISYEIGTIKIDGEEFVSLSITAKISGVNMYQTMIAVKCGGYLANIAVTTFNENNVNDIFAKFYTIK